MELSEFRQGLQRVMQSPFERPFVCQRSPLDCTVFVVGINPATRMTTPFWDYWRDADGFLYEEWQRDYRKERLAAGKSADSNTRLRLARLTRALDAYGYKCLETNLYATPTERASKLAPGFRRTAVFEYLLQQTRPRIILIHGQEPGNLVPPMLPGAKVIKVEHLSRISYARVQEIAELVLTEFHALPSFPEGSDPNSGSDYHHHPEIWDEESEEAWLQAMKQRRNLLAVSKDNSLSGASVDAQENSPLKLCIAYCDAKGTRKNERQNGDLSYFRLHSPGIRAVTIRPSSRRVDVYNIVAHQVPAQFSGYIQDRTRPHLRIPLERWGKDVEGLIDGAFDS